MQLTVDGYMWKPAEYENLESNWFLILRREAIGVPKYRPIIRHLIRAMKRAKVSSKRHAELGDFVLRLQRLSAIRYPDYKNLMIEYSLHFRVYEDWKSSILELIKDYERSQDHNDANIGSAGHATNG